MCKQLFQSRFAYNGVRRIMKRRLLRKWPNVSANVTLPKNFAEQFTKVGCIPHSLRTFFLHYTPLFTATACMKLFTLGLILLLKLANCDAGLDFLGHGSIPLVVEQGTMQQSALRTDRNSWMQSTTQCHPMSIRCAPSISPAHELLLL